MATLRPNRVLMSCSYNVTKSCVESENIESIYARQRTRIAFGACSEMSAVSPLIPIVVKEVWKLLNVFSGHGPLARA